MSYLLSSMGFLIFFLVIKVVSLLINKFGLNGINLYTLKPFDYEFIDYNSDDDNNIESKYDSLVYDIYSYHKLC